MPKAKKPDAQPADDKITEAKILGMLEEKHSGADCLFFKLLRTATGFTDARTMDAYAFYIYQKDQRKKIAYEVKISKSDFMREIHDPDKRREAMLFSNQYYFVAPKGMIAPRELPEGTGLMEVSKSVIRTRSAAPWKKCDTLPDWFIASLLHRDPDKAGSNLKLFRYAGREMTKEELKTLLDESIDWHTQEKIDEEVKARIKRWKEQDKIASLIAVFKDVMPWSLGHGDCPSGEQFKKWLDEQRNGLPIEFLQSAVQYHAKALHSGLAQLLGEFRGFDRRRDKAITFEQWRTQQRVRKARRRNARRKKQE